MQDVLRDLVVDARPTQNEHRHRGVGRYVSGLLDAMVHLDMRPRLLVHGDRPVPASIASLPRLKSRRPHILRYHGGWLADEALISIQARRGHWRLFHATDPEAVPDPRLVPLVVTVYDLIPMVDRQVWAGMAPLQRLGFRRMLTNVRRARAVVAISASVRDDIASSLGVPESRITVARAGIRLHDWPARPGGARSGVLFVGAPAPHKNLDLLLRSLARIPRADRPSLTVVGPWVGSQAAAFQERSDQIGVVARVEAHASHQRLVELYHSAALLAVPSRHEGFGLPALEAMATGCPVVVSSTPALEEVVGDAGVVVNVTDESELAGAIRTVAGDAREQERLGRAGLQRAQLFSWERSARDVLSCYAGALDRDDA
jgi:glycosyltransferase involved in cell wall biosynthesis